MENSLSFLITSQFVSGLPKKLTLNKLALIGEPEKTRKTKENPIFYLYFLAIWHNIREVINPQALNEWSAICTWTVR